MATEARLTAMGGDDLGDSLAQFESLYERARGLGSLLAERRRGIDRDRSAFVDQGVIATLEAEAARLAAELARGRGRGRPRSSRFDVELAAAEQALADAARRATRTTGPTGVAPPSSQAAEIRGELGALRSSVERGESELARVRSRLDGLADKSTRLTAEADRLRAEIAEAEQAELPLVEALDGAEEWRGTAETARAEADSAHRAAESDHHAWVARAEALAMAIDEARSRAGADRLSGSEGVLGTLAELIEIDEGWEAAFEAAAGDALATVVVDQVDTARRSLHALDGESLDRRGAGPGRPTARPVPRRRWASRCAATCAPRACLDARILGSRCRRRTCSTRWWGRRSWSPAAGPRRSTSPWPIPTPRS